MGTQTAFTPSSAKTSSMTCGRRTCATGFPGVANRSVSPSITAPPRQCGSDSRLSDCPAQEQPIQIRIVEKLARGTVQCEPPHLEHQRAVRVLERAAHILLH